MARQTLLWRCLAAVLAASALPATAMAQLRAADIAAVLDGMAEGRDPAFPQTLAMAWTLDANQPLPDRIRAANAEIAREIEQVANAFVLAPPAGRIAAAKDAVAQLDPAAARDGAAYEFQGSGPSLAILRQLLFVPGQSGLVDTVMAISSAFVRSPKPDDTYFVYSDAADIRRSAVTELAGSDTSWTAGAQPPMTPGVVYAIKKCRHLFVLGWFCNTSLYQVRDLPGSRGRVKLLLTALLALPPGADNAAFTGGRASNVADGFTAVYVVLSADDMVLIFNPGIQSKTGSNSFQGRLEAGLQEQYRQLRQRLGTELGLGDLPY